MACSRIIHTGFSLWCHQRQRRCGCFWKAQTAWSLPGELVLILEHKGPEKYRGQKVRLQPLANRQCCRLWGSISSLRDPEQCRNSSEIKRTSYSSLQSAAYAGAYAVLGEFELVFLSHVLELLKECVKKNVSIHSYFPHSLRKTWLIFLWKLQFLFFIYVTEEEFCFQKTEQGELWDATWIMRVEKWGPSCPPHFHFPCIFFSVKIISPLERKFRISRWCI